MLNLSLLGGLKYTRFPLIGIKLRRFPAMLCHTKVEDGGGSVGKCIYVGNLSYDVESQDLKDLMTNVGHVIRASVLKSPNGRSKGCGLVQFGSAADADNAIMNLHHIVFKGRRIFVREDRVNNYYSSEPKLNADSSLNNNRVFVSKMDYKTKWFDLKAHFKQAGHVTRADVRKVFDDIHPSGIGFVEFASAEEAENAVKMLHNSQLNGKVISVKEYIKEPPK